MAKIKNKMLRQAIIAFVVLIVVIGDLVYYKMKDPYRADANSMETGGIVVINLDPSAIESVEIQDNSDEAVKLVTKLRNTEEGLKVEERRFLNKEGKHEEDSRKMKELSDNEIKLLEISLTELKALSVIEENATDIEQYGMNDPTCVITMILKDEGMAILKVGDRLPTNSTRYYFMVNDDNKIYAISEFDVKNFINQGDNNIIDIT